MFEDPNVEEVRAIRQKHAAGFNFDLKKNAQDLKEKQEQSKRKIVSYSPKLIKGKREDFEKVMKAVPSVEPEKNDCI